MDFLSFRKTLLSNLNERRIGVVREPVTIEVPIDNSSHGDDRKYRHIDDTPRGSVGEITDAEIKMTVELAMPMILKDLTNGILRIEDRSLDIIDEFHIKNNFTKLNLICVLKNDSKYGNKLYLKIITVMRKENFIPTKNTKKTYYVQ
jgi:hypothetical protein